MNFIITIIVIKTLHFPITSDFVKKLAHLIYSIKKTFVHLMFVDFAIRKLFNSELLSNQIMLYCSAHKYMIHVGKFCKQDNHCSKNHTAKSHSTDHINLSFEYKV